MRGQLSTKKLITGSKNVHVVNYDLEAPKLIKEEKYFQPLKPSVLARGLKSRDL